MKEWTNKEFDSTILILGGVMLSILVVGGLFYLHLKNAPDTSVTLLDGAVVMALVNMPQTMVAYALGKRNGEATSTAALRQEIKDEVIRELQNQLEDS